jgi:hypothetical protein
MGAEAAQISMLRSQAEVEGMSNVERQVEIKRKRAQVVDVGNAVFVGAIICARVCSRPAATAFRQRIFELCTDSRETRAVRGNVALVVHQQETGQHDGF